MSQRVDYSLLMSQVESSQNIIIQYYYYDTSTTTFVYSTGILAYCHTVPSICLFSCCCPNFECSCFMFFLLCSSVDVVMENVTTSR